MKIENSNLTRREFQRLGALAFAAACFPGIPRSALADHHQLVTDFPENEALLEQLQYVHVSEKPEQNCANCLLYTAGAAGAGKCQILPQGLVKETGWCLTWSPKPE